VNTWRRRLATGDMKGILPAMTLASLRAASVASIAPIATSPGPPIVCDDEILRRVARQGTADDELE
jgi:hypothetical protein